MNMALARTTTTQCAGPQQQAIAEDPHRPSPWMVGIEAAEVDARKLASIVTTAFRSHGHICNVMTHISGARWDRVEEALCAILDPRAGQRELTSLAANIVDLLCADRGVTGRIVKPHFEALLARILPSDVAARLCVHVACLSCEQADRPGRAKGSA